MSDIRSTIFFSIRVYVDLALLSMSTNTRFISHSTTQMLYTYGVV